MALLLNLRHLELREQELEGSLAPDEVGLAAPDELIRPAGTLEYCVTAEQQEGGILLQGSLRMAFMCDCARCLRTFPLEIDLSDWSFLVPLEGEEAAEIRGDCVDLTPYFREDMVLALPQRPLCKPDCGGLADRPPGASQSTNTANSPVGPSSVWRELDKLRF